jgi:hypothetical protein
MRRLVGMGLGEQPARLSSLLWRIFDGTDHYSAEPRFIRPAFYPAHEAHVRISWFFGVGIPSAEPTKQISIAEGQLSSCFVLRLFYARIADVIRITRAGRLTSPANWTFLGNVIRIRIRLEEGHAQ